MGTGALEAGLNLQHASLLVSVIATWNPARERQREGRLRRIGSPHRVVEHVVVRPDVPLEVWEDRRHQRKQALERVVLAAVPGPVPANPAVA